MTVKALGAGGEESNKYDMGPADNGMFRVELGACDATPRWDKVAVGIHEYGKLGLMSERGSTRHLCAGSSTYLPL